MIVIMAEKPSVARDIARVLNVRGSGDGCITGNGYTVTSALGHLVTQCEPDEIDENMKNWRMDTLPFLPETIPDISGFEQADRSIAVPRTKTINSLFIIYPPS